MFNTFTIYIYIKYVCILLGELVTERVSGVQELVLDLRAGL